MFGELLNKLNSGEESKLVDESKKSRLKEHKVNGRNHRVKTLGEMKTEDMDREAFDKIEASIDVSDADAFKDVASGVALDLLADNINDNDLLIYLTNILRIEITDAYNLVHDADESKNGKKEAPVDKNKSIKKPVKRARKNERKTVSKKTNK